MTMKNSGLAAVVMTGLAVAVTITLAGTSPVLVAQQTPAAAPSRQAPAERESLTPGPDRRADEGKGPFKTLVIRGVTLIDGTGAPPQGPMDIVVQGNRIASVRSAGTPGLAARANRPPQNADHEIDATGMYLMPGFVDMHVHAGGAPKNQESEYAYKLWLGHGVTTVRGVPIGGQPYSVKDKARSEKNEIVAPRIYNYQRPGSGWDRGGVDTPEAAREYVRWAAANGIDGLKLGAQEPSIMAALLDEAKKQGLGSTAHLQQGGVAQMNAIKAARLGLGTVTHFYGHFESLLKDYVVQPWPVDMNANDEQWRFGQVARLWNKIHEPGSPQWKAYLEEHLKLGTVFDPTLTIYSAGRDLAKFRNAEWHDKYTLPSLMAFYAPSRANHGSYWYYWTTEDEIEWRNFYQVWFKLLNDYKKMGGRITTGSDSGFIYQTYGFGYVERAGDAAGSRLPPPRGHSGSDDEWRHHAGGTKRPRAGVRDRARRYARRHGDRRSEPAAELQGPVRHRSLEAERQDRSAREGRWREVHDQGRHRVRREATAGRRRRDGREAEAREAGDGDFA